MPTRAIFPENVFHGSHEHRISFSVLKSVLIFRAQDSEYVEQRLY